MSDPGKLIALVLVIVVGGALFFPMVYNKALGGGAPDLAPALEQMRKDKITCVESTAFMRSSHMILLNNWRTEVIRDGSKGPSGTYHPFKMYKSNNDKKEYEMSLQNGCMKCHTSKAQFCDKCHNYVGAAPKCWDCHIPPVEKTPAADKTAGRSKIDG